MSLIIYILLKVYTINLEKLKLRIFGGAFEGYNGQIVENLRVSNR